MLPLLLTACLVYEPPDSVATEDPGDPTPTPIPTPTPTPNPSVDPVTESWVQGFTSAVDVLFVIDNSSSMPDEQALLVEGMGGFLTSLDDFDFHIGVVATDITLPEFSGKLQAVGTTRFITSEDVDPAGLFAGMVEQVGVITGTQETGRAAAWLALESLASSETNIGFQRDEAALHIVFVSDTFDNSGSVPISNPDFRDWAFALKAPPARVVMHGIVQLNGDPACTGIVRPGAEYIGYASVFGGVAGSICEASLEPVLLDIVATTRDLNDRFPMTGTPDPATLEISVDAPDAPVSFSMCFDIAEDGCDVLYVEDRSLLIFLDYVPPLDAEITAEYTPL